MKRLLFVVLMMVYSVSWAEWEIINISNQGDIVLYTDKSTIQRNRETVKIWVLTDFSYVSVQTDKTGGIYKSYKEELAFKCLEEKFSVLSRIHFSDSMGKGNVVFSANFKQKEQNWVAVTVGTSDEVLLKIACDKK